jgi:hypothetical protein
MTAKRTRRLRLTLTALLPSLPLTSAWTGNSSPKVRIQVCQNKDCCSRWSGSGSLVDALQDLIPPESVTAGVTVEATGCLSRCGTGPNVCLKLAGSPDTQLHEVENAVAASVKLQTATAGSIQLPPKLLAAVSVMEKAQKGMFIVRSFLRSWKGTAASYRVADKSKLYLDWCYLQPREIVKGVALILCCSTESWNLRIYDIFYRLSHYIVVCCVLS